MWNLNDLWGQRTLIVIRKSLVYHLHTVHSLNLFFCMDLGLDLIESTEFFFKKEEKRKSSYLLISTYMLLFFIFNHVGQVLSFKRNYISCFNVIENLPIRLMNQNLLFFFVFFILYTQNQFILLSNFHRLVIWITKY